MIVFFALMLAAPNVGKMDVASLMAAMKESDRLKSKRLPKVKAILAAIGRQDRKALKRTGVVGVPYFLGHSQPERSASQASTPFGIESLTPLAACKIHDIYDLDLNALTAHWDCPEDVNLPWSSVATEFRFDGMTIVEVRTRPGRPLIVKPPAK